MIRLVRGEPVVRAAAPERARINLPALTGLRILAAFAVYLSHVGLPEAAPSWSRSLAANGYAGVTLFFILSGFVLAITYADSLRRPTPRGVFDYLVARLARVYPLYLAVLAFVLIDLRAKGVTTPGWWRHALALQAWDADVFSAFNYNGPGWSISVEFFLYACFPIAILIVARLRKGFLAASAIAVFTALAAVTFWFTARAGDSSLDPGSTHRWLYRNPALRLGDFILGVILGVLYLRTRRSRLAPRVGGAMIIGGAAGLAALLCNRNMIQNGWSWDFAYVLPACLLILGLALAPGSRGARLLSTRQFVVAGEASFAFYLVHAVVLTRIGLPPWTTGGLRWAIAFALFELVGILLLSVGLHRYFEIPARDLIRRALVARRKPSHGPTAGAPAVTQSGELTAAT